MNHAQVIRVSRLVARLAIILAVLAATFLVSVAPVQSAAGINRYVATNGTNDSDCANSADPCLTITYALTQSAAGDTILLARGVYYEHLTIDKSIRIVRNPDSLCPFFRYISGLFVIIPCPTIDGSNSGRVINITNYNAEVNLEKITIQNGQVTDAGGAGIFNEGILTLDDVIVRENEIILSDPGNSSNYLFSGGGINNRHDLLMRNSKVNNNAAFDGGGIFTPVGSTVIQNSEIFNNTAQRNGGGIALPYGETSTIENSTIRGNSTLGTGGGMLISDNGHPTTTGLHYFRNVTISGNTAGYGGGLYSSVHVELNHCTLAMNSAPNVPELYLAERQWDADEEDPEVAHSGIYSTIISNPPALSYSSLCHINGFDANPFFLSGGGNISGDESCHFTDGTDLQNTDPGLLPLGNYGGPVWTHALPAGSLAIDLGHLFFNGADARGIPTQDGNLDGDVEGDSGAYEFEPEHVFIPLVSR